MGFTIEAQQDTIFTLYEDRVGFLRDRNESAAHRGVAAPPYRIRQPEPFI